MNAIQGLFFGVIVIVLDVLIAMLMGTTFYLLWGWLIIPTMELTALSWAACVAIVFLIRFTTGKVANIDMDTIDDVKGHIISTAWKAIVRNVVFIMLGYLLAIVII